MKTSTGLNVFFLTIQVNPSKYAVEVCCFLVPSATNNPSGYVASSVGFPATPFVVQPAFPAAFNIIVGYPAGWVGSNFFNQASSSGYINGVQYTWNSSITSVSYLSSKSPQVNPNATIYMALSSINNPYALPSSIIYAISPTNGIGGVIIDKPPQFCWNKFIDGTYNELSITFLGTDLSPVKINDPNMTILLAIKDGDEYNGK